MSKNVCKESPITTLFFIIALIATISIRLIGIAGLFSGFIAKFLWYVGIVGFLLFFIYKFKAENARRKIVSDTNIIEKIVNDDKIPYEDKEILVSILCSLTSKKDIINYFVIFFTSGVSLVIALLFDLKIIK
jgi:hypothetical protein